MGQAYDVATAMDYLDKKNAMAAWKERQASRQRCNICNGTGIVLSGDLRKPAGHGRTCGCPFGRIIEIQEIAAGIRKGEGA